MKYFTEYIDSIDENHRGFMVELHQFLIEHSYTCEIKEAKSGFLVSYQSLLTKKTLANVVFRKSGLKIRLYLEHIADYQELLVTLPETMQKDIQASSICKRLVNPEKCNPRCSMGFTFDFQGIRYQKCRNSAFMPTINDENKEAIKSLLENEVYWQA